MINLEAEKKFEEIKKWYFEEWDKIDEKYPSKVVLTIV